MELNKNDIVNGLTKLGLERGASVLIHSSLKSLGYVDGGAVEFIEALLETVGEEGTLVVPTITGKEADSPDNPPNFDVRYTPCWTGIVPETFRKMQNAVRSLHPTHSVSAIGANSLFLTGEHAFGNSPCDEKSPYYKNTLIKGYIMLVGVTQESNTTIHCCEEIAGVPYHLQKDYTEAKITAYDGREMVVRNKLHDWHKPPTDFMKFDEIYLKSGIIRRGKVGNSVITLINAFDMLQISVEILKNDPLFLLSGRQS